MSAKDAVRQNFIQRRRDNVTVKASADQELHRRLTRFLEDFSGLLMAYRPTASEADPFLGQFQLDWAFPRVTDHGLQVCRVTKDVEFVMSSWGVAEPGPTATVIEPAQVNMVLIPGVAFDQNGGRLGRGQGHYDRFLKRLNPACQRVGIAYSFQVSETRLPANEWDERVDWVVTESYVLHVERVI